MAALLAPPLRGDPRPHSTLSDESWLWVFMVWCGHFQDVLAQVVQ